MHLTYMPSRIESSLRTGEFHHINSGRNVPHKTGLSTRVTRSVAQNNNGDELFRHIKHSHNPAFLILVGHLFEQIQSGSGAYTSAL
jgi:hypothetical protein